MHFLKSQKMDENYEANAKIWMKYRYNIIKVQIKLIKSFTWVLDHSESYEKIIKSKQFHALILNPKKLISIFSGYGPDTL